MTPYTWRLWLTLPVLLMALFVPSAYWHFSCALAGGSLSGLGALRVATWCVLVGSLYLAAAYCCYRLGEWFDLEVDNDLSRH